MDLGAMRGNEQKRVRDAYGLSFLLVLVATLAVVATGAPLLSPLTGVAALLQAGALLITLRVSGVERLSSAIGSIIVVLLFAAVVIAVVWVPDSVRIPSTFAWLFLTLTTIGAIARRLVTYDEVTLQALMGLLVIYMLIGMSFGLSYGLLDAFDPPGLIPEGQGISGAVYYSFVTLATLGYGDVLPGNDIARAFAIAEALIGQLYLVGVVSLAVSHLGRRRPSDRREEIE